MSMHRKKFLLGDVVIIALVLVLAVVVAVPYILAPTSALYCEVQQDGAVIRRVKLAEGYQDSFVIEGADVHNTVEIDGMRVRIATADCIDQVCVQTSWITRAGQATVCLPNRVIVKLVGDTSENDVDVIA